MEMLNRKSTSLSWDPVCPNFVLPSGLDISPQERNKMQTVLYIVASTAVFRQSWNHQFKLLVLLYKEFMSFKTLLKFISTIQSLSIKSSAPTYSPLYKISLWHIWTSFCLRYRPEPAEDLPECPSEAAASPLPQRSHGRQQPDETAADREGEAETETTGAASAETPGQESLLK